MVVLATVKIGGNSRVTIPKEVRQLLDVEEGNEIVFFRVEGLIKHVCIRKK